MLDLRLRHIDALRGIAAIMVVYIHCSYPLNDIRETGKYGYLGVYIFFVISGFILPYNLYKSKYQLINFPVFVYKRILRLDPPYFVAVFFAILLPVLNGRPVPEWPSILAHTAYLNEVLGFNWASGVFWTLAIEFQFYLFMALGFLGYITKSNLYSLIFITATLLLSVLLTNRVYLPAWLGFFSLGAMVFRRLILNMPLVLFIPAIILNLLIILYKFGVPELIASTFCVLFILFVRMDKRNLPVKLLVGLGTISYSLYLTHIEIIKISMRLTESVPFLVYHSFLRLIIGIVLSILFACVFYYFIERPFKLRSNKIKYQSSP